METHGKNVFAEIYIYLKIYLDLSTDLKIISLNYQNVYVECSSMMNNATKNFDISAMIFERRNTIIFRSVDKYLEASTKFFSCERSNYVANLIIKFAIRNIAYESGKYSRYGIIRVDHIKRSSAVYVCLVTG